MSEELLQRNLHLNPEKIGSWDFYNIGATTIKALKNYKIIPNRDYKDFESRKPDGLIVDKKSVIAVIENKNISAFKTKKDKQKAIKQGLEVAEALGAKIVIATDSKETIWVNALNGEEILDEKGREIKTVFDPKNSDIAKLIERMVDCVRVDNSRLDNKKYSILSLFTGCGGLDLGLLGGFTFLDKKYKKHNFEIAWANDIDANACLTFSKNFHHQIVCGDIRDIIKNKMGMFDNPLPDEVDVVVGGFPCQDFSIAGKRKGFEAERGTLYQSMAEIIKKTQPKIFLAENVKGLLTMNDGEAIKQIIKDFGELGYNVSYKLFLTADFGVPQKRERVVIVGTKKDAFPDFIFPEPPLKKENWISLEKAIGDLEGVEEGGFANHFWSKAKKNKGQGNNAVSKDEPGPTMRAEHHGNIEFHWNEKRRLSAREAARIQSFPDDFVFYPSTSSAYKQIGNAVPPVFGWYLGEAIENFLNTHSSKNLHLKN